MPAVPLSIDIVASDMGRTLAFFTALGLDTSAMSSTDLQGQILTPGGLSIGLIAESLMRKSYPDWVTPVGQRVTFACRCDSPADVDAVYAAVETAGFGGGKAPWDAFWGQRYAFLNDPDGNRIDLFADQP
jgi:catechol 2,3-dioxygenase-like lactoylglutathione lyase family enzyme